MSATPRAERPVWVAVSPPPPLAVGDVHVWIASLEATSDQVESLYSALDPTERQRADRYRFPADRRRFVVGRQLLRRRIAHYLGMSPGEVEFGYTSFGKPYLLAPAGTRRLQFNVSHSEEVALLAFAWERSLGVDVERIRPEVLGEGIAEHFFSALEISTLASLPPEEQARAFFVCWTRKEAFVKARGEGLSMALDRFDVSLAPRDPAALLRVADDDVERLRWSMHDLPWIPAHAAALVVEGACERVQCLSVRGDEIA